MKPTHFIGSLLLSSALLPAVADDAFSARRAQQIVEQYMASPYAPPGVSVAIVTDEGPLFVEGYGVADIDAGTPVTADTVFYNASVTKSYTGMAVVALADRAEVDLDASLWPIIGSSDHQERASLTFRTLLTHDFDLSVEPLGIVPAFIRRPSPEDVFLFTRFASAPRDPGFRYTNEGYIIADAALATLRGEDFRTIVEDEVLTPLQMNSTYLRTSDIPEGRLATGYEVFLDGYSPVPAKPDALLHAAGGMFTTANDAAIWLEALLNQGVVDGEQRLPASVVTAALEPQVEQDRSFGPLDRDAYAFGWNVSTLGGERIYEHGGGFPGARAWVTFMPDQELGIAVFANVGNGGNQFIVGLLSDLYSELLNGNESDAETLTWLPQVEAMLESGWTSERRYLQNQYDLIEDDAAPEILNEYIGTYAAEGNVAELIISRDGTGVIGRIGEIRVDFYPMATRAQILGDAGLGYRRNLEPWAVTRDESDRPETLTWDGITFTRQAD